MDYRIDRENPVPNPVVTIEEIEYANRPFLKYDFYGWGGAGVQIEDTSRFCEEMGKSISYIKKYCEPRRFNC
ncbi:MAG: hypothetical protein HC786_20385 [Richelia sp. CSU_2_1]|nr:hypothetical protein [Microcoleus sp. SU_5_6]NJR24335.1 hypothetical protein [Richelia sp. CSU_2_1]